MKLSATMKSVCYTLIITLFLALSATTGCSKKIAVDTVNLEYSFQTAEDKTQTTVTEAIEAIEKADYTAAVDKLKQVSANTNLTTEQKTAVDNVIAQIEKR